MLSFTSLLWNHLPELKFVQLPWRWLLCLNAALVLLAVMAWKQSWPRLLAYAVMLGVVFFVWHRVQPPWWDHTVDVQNMQSAMQSGHGYEGSDEYVPINADGYEIDPAMRKATLNGPGHAQIRVLEWAAQEKEFTARVSEPTTLAVRLFNYPAWRVEVNGRVVSAETQETTGIMIVPLDAGENAVTISFIRTWDRMAGGVISALAFFLVAAVSLWQIRTSELPD